MVCPFRDTRRTLEDCGARSKQLSLPEPHGVHLRVVGAAWGEAKPYYLHL